MESKLLFTRKINKEEYKFFFHKGKGVFGIEDEYVSVETPSNGLGYTDTIMFHRATGTPYTLHRYCPMWIKKKVKEILIKNGYGEYVSGR